MEWENGRELSRITRGSKIWDFTYDMAGVRSGKTVTTTNASTGATTTTHYKYITLSGKLIRQECGSQKIDFIYDEDGRPYAMVYESSTKPKCVYYYILNAQGDVVALMNETGSVVADYTYDEWGKLISVTGSNTTMGNINPLRYRGYIYDRDTGLYYLQSRYYDPEIGRFINADEFVTTDVINLLGSNMFAYCENNPIIYYDQSGRIAELAFAGLAGNVLVGGNALVAGTANLWNPIGWTILGAIALTTICVVTYNVAKAVQPNAVNRAAALMDYASTAASPPPPNRGGKGTQVTSKTLYNKGGKNGFRIDVENPGNRTGQIHLQKNGVKYYYNVADKTFRIGSSSGRLAPESIQKLLTNPEIIKAIGKGLTILGY